MRNTCFSSKRAIRLSSFDVRRKMLLLLLTLISDCKCRGSIISSNQKHEYLPSLPILNLYHSKNASFAFKNQNQRCQEVRYFFFER